MNHASYFPHVPPPVFIGAAILIFALLDALAQAVMA